MTKTLSHKKQKLLVLLDSQAVLHRAFHALPNFTSPAGLPTGALYGFSAFLLRILKEFRPDYIAACYDLAAPTFRHAAYKKYKAQRPKIDTDLIVQIDRSKDILRAFGIPIFELAGFEADDILGTIAAKTKDIKDLKIIIASGDLDLLQVVQGNRVVVYTLKKGISDTIIYNEENVKKRFGFPSNLIPDFKALKGDPSDNIPGVAGIGEKTAQELIQKFGSLEEIYRSLEGGDAISLGGRISEKGRSSYLKKTGIKKRVIEILKQNKEEAFFSRGLTEIRKDAPIKFDLSLFQKKTERSKKDIIKIFEELGFKSLIRRLDEVSYCFKESGTAELTPPSVLTEVSAPKNTDFQDALKKTKEIFWLLNEEDKVICIIKSGFLTEELNSSEENNRVFEFSEADFEKDKAFFQGIFCLGHGVSNYAFNAKDLYHYFEHFDLAPNFDFDAAIAVWLLDSERNSPTLLDVLKIAGVDIPIPATESLGFGQDFNGKSLFESRKRLLKKLEKENLLRVFRDIEMPLIKILKDIENNGILIDRARFKNLSADCGEKLKNIENEIWKLAGEKFNVNSTKELRRILFEKLAIEMSGVRKTEGGVRSTKFSELVKIKNRHPIIQEIMSFRELAKLKSTYIESLPLLAKEDGRIHTIFNQTGTVTGRLSSFHPNLQNIPVKGKWAKKIRETFIAPAGWKLVSFDYSQIELRIAAHLSGDEKMKRAFEETQDIHSLTASEIFNVPLKEVTPEMRRKAKVINFGVLYGMGARALSESLNITKKEAEIYRDEYFNDFQGVAAYIQKTIEEARENGYVQTIFGRKRYFKEIDSLSEMEKREIERMAINMPIQGSAADIIKIAMVKIDEFLEKTPILQGKVKMILQIHDELIFEIKEKVIDEAIKIVKNVMENVCEDKINPTLTRKCGMKLPVEVHTGNNWGELSS